MKMIGMCIHKMHVCTRKMIVVSPTQLRALSLSLRACSQHGMLGLMLFSRNAPRFRCHHAAVFRHPHKKGSSRRAYGRPKASCGPFPWVLLTLSLWAREPPWTVLTACSWLRDRSNFVGSQSDTYLHLPSVTLLRALWSV